MQRLLDYGLPPLAEPESSAQELRLSFGKESNNAITERSRFEYTGLNKSPGSDQGRSR
jgi:hypothetical protein